MKKKIIVSPAPGFNGPMLIVSTHDRRKSKTLILSSNVDEKIIRNRQSKHCFYRVLIRVRRLLRAFLIATYPVWCRNDTFCILQTVYARIQKVLSEGVQL